MIGSIALETFTCINQHCQNTLFNKKNNTKVNKNNNNTIMIRLGI